MSGTYKFLELSSREDAVSVAVDIIQAELDLAIAKRGMASFLLSGGSSPKPIYEALSGADINWSAVSVGLVDERWVREGAPGSNASFVRSSLLQNKAAEAIFLPMTTSDDSAAQGIAEVHERYMALGVPFDVTVMGMGTDGHTASWFPDSDGLAAALDMKTPGLVSSVMAQGCPGAGDFPERITLTRPAVLSSSNLFLFITGAEKRAVFDAAVESDITDAPVKALLDAGERLTVIWAP